MAAVAKWKNNGHKDQLKPSSPGFQIVVTRGTCAKATMTTGLCPAENGQITISTYSWLLQIFNCLCIWNARVEKTKQKISPKLLTILILMSTKQWETKKNIHAHICLHKRIKNYKGNENVNRIRTESHIGLEI